MEVTEEDFYKMEKLLRMRKAEAQDISDINALYLRYINPQAHLCNTCPKVIRQTYTRLMDWFLKVRDEYAAKYSA